MKLLQLRKHLLKHFFLQQLQKFMTRLITLHHHHLIQRVNDGLFLCVVVQVKVVVGVFGVNVNVVVLDLLYSGAGEGGSSVDEKDLTQSQ